MTVYIFSSSFDIGQIIRDHLSSFDYSCFLFKTTNNLSSSIKNLKKLPDLVILDYTMFNHDFFNIYTYLRDRKLNLPVIFFNDPCVTASTRTRHWLIQLEALVPVITKENKEQYSILLKRLEDLIELEELKPYIKLMQKEKPLPSSLINKPITAKEIKNRNDNYIEDFRERVNLPQNLFYILKIFQKNEGIPLSLKTITEIYQKDCKKMTENSLKVLISNLKSKMFEDKQCKFIIKSSNGTYVFMSFGNIK